MTFDMLSSALGRDSESIGSGQWWVESTGKKARNTKKKAKERLVTADVVNQT